MSNILGFGNEDSDMDLDYFRQLIADKVNSSEQQSYIEALAMKQMNEDVDAEEELQNALDEIKKNEKDMGMIAMVAQTLLEKQDELQQQVQEPARDESWCGAFFP